MRWLSVVLALASLAAAEPARPFPLPSLNGKPLAVSAGQHVFHVPLRWARVESFYRDQFAHDAHVTIATSDDHGQRVLTLTSRRPGDVWASASLREADLETLIDVKFWVRAHEEKVDGSGRPEVELVLTRSADVDKMVNSIDHLQR